jgi:hypothetical protein
MVTFPMPKTAHISVTITPPSGGSHSSRISWAASNDPKSFGKLTQVQSQAGSGCHPYTTPPTSEAFAKDIDWPGTFQYLLIVANVSTWTDIYCNGGEENWVWYDVWDTKKTPPAEVSNFIYLDQ